MKITDQNIQYYLDKFFEGATTREEEIALSDYFKTARTFPAGIEDYKPMFEWIDNGMPEIEEHAGDINPTRRKIRVWTWAIAAAAVLVLSFTVWNSYIMNSSRINVESIYAGSYICHAGVINNDIKSILPEIQSTIQQIDEMERMVEELDFELVKIEVN